LSSVKAWPTVDVFASTERFCFYFYFGKAQLLAVERTNWLLHSGRQGARSAVFIMYRCVIQFVGGGFVASVRGLRCKLDGYPAFSYRPGVLESLHFNDAVLFIDSCTCGRHSVSDIYCCLPRRH
jgi:hypothetical protein